MEQPTKILWLNNSNKELIIESEKSDKCPLKYEVYLKEFAFNNPMDIKESLNTILQGLHRFSILANFVTIDNHKFSICERGENHPRKFYLYSLELQEPVCNLTIKQNNLTVYKSIFNVMKSQETKIKWDSSISILIDDVIKEIKSYAQENNKQQFNDSIDYFNSEWNIEDELNYDKKSTGIKLLRFSTCFTNDIQINVNSKTAIVEAVYLLENEGEYYNNGHETISLEVLEAEKARIENRIMFLTTMQSKFLNKQIC